MSELDSVTVTGNNNYSGTYTSADYDYFWVLGRANNGGHEDFDVNDGNEVFVFGNLQYKSTTVTDTNYVDDSNSSGTSVSDGTYQTTATGTSADTLHFGFTFHEAQPGDIVSFFDSAFWYPYSHPDYDFTYETNGSASNLQGYYDQWVASLGSTYQFSGSTDIECLENNSTDGSNGNDTTAHDNYLTLNVTATAPGTDASLTSDNGGDKTLLGFSVGSDHIALDNVTDESMFSQYFTIDNTATHQSANDNTVHDTIISLEDGSSWSVDLYGVDTSGFDTSTDAGKQALTDYVWNNIILQA
jgi:hypothetical protein